MGDKRINIMNSKISNPMLISTQITELGQVVIYKIYNHFVALVYTRLHRKPCIVLDGDKRAASSLAMPGAVHKLGLKIRNEKNKVDLMRSLDPSNNVQCPVPGCKMH